MIDNDVQNSIYICHTTVVVNLSYIVFRATKMTERNDKKIEIFVSQKDDKKVTTDDNNSEKLTMTQSELYDTCPFCVSKATNWNIE